MKFNDMSLKFAKIKMTISSINLDIDCSKNNRFLLTVSMLKELRKQLRAELKVPPRRLHLLASNYGTRNQYHSNILLFPDSLLLIHQHKTQDSPPQKHCQKFTTSSSRQEMHQKAKGYILVQIDYWSRYKAPTLSEYNLSQSRSRHE